IHAANNYDICTKLARDEWDFQGVIMTDWTTTNHGPDCTAAGCVRAGNDLIMPGQQMDHDNLNAELDAGILTIEEVQRTVVRLLKALKK
ncbi:MAG: beta-glucosidase, partial [Lachnospiraceae bacterium]|nr:beta-glucosidase [Lachnospiraceae bacterium]